MEENEMAKVIVTTSEAPQSLAGYSQAVKSGGLVFVSGQGPFDARTGEVVGTTIQEQTAQCLKNIAAILQAANSSLEKAVSATFILGEESAFAGMNEEWGNGFPRIHQPARERNCPFIRRA
jgi:2-iminobutanoate/2-iminopropanoate deaminase